MNNINSIRFRTYRCTETIIAAIPVLQITLMSSILKLMAHPMHSGLLMRTIVAFCTITDHICQPLRTDLFSHGVLG